MDERKDDIVSVAKAIRSDRYRDASAVFAAGSILRGEGTAYSDLDLVVVYTKLPCAYRESFRLGGYPVEAFVHDVETVEYFFCEVDRPSGIPALAHMVLEGVEIPSPSDVSQALKERAASVIAAGPPALDAATDQRWRYAITNLLDDLRDPRSHDELVGTGTQLYEQLAAYHLRRQGLWSAEGKAIPRVLQRADPALCTKYSQSFERLFKNSEARDVINLAEELLRDGGGLLFEGYRSDAPPTWRSQKRGTAV
jgi:predicted nucleotidyltransferase